MIDASYSATEVVFNIIYNNYLSTFSLDRSTTTWPSPWTWTCSLTPKKESLQKKIRSSKNSIPKMTRMGVANTQRQLWLMRTISTPSKVRTNQYVYVHVYVCLYRGPTYCCSPLYHFISIHPLYILHKALIAMYFIDLISSSRYISFLLNISYFFLTFFLLTGIVAHIGAIDRGHYYSFIKERSSDKWLEFNDRTVLPFSAEVRHATPCYSPILRA